MLCHFYFFFKVTATTEIYTNVHTLSRHDALPISRLQIDDRKAAVRGVATQHRLVVPGRQPGGLELQIILVRPEPGDGVIGRFVADEDRKSTRLNSSH